MSMERRSFFSALIGAGTIPVEILHRKNRRKHHRDTRLYHGPMFVPADVAETLRESPESVYRTTCQHLALRYVDGAGVVWVFRSRIPEGRAMVGEIVRTEAEAIRVHCWTAVDWAPSFRGAREIIAARISAPEQPQTLPAPEPEWEEIGGQESA